MALHHNPRIVTSDLTIALDAGDVNSYLGSGATAYDLSGNSHHATLVNGLSYSTSNRGVFSLDGTNDEIVFTSVNNIGGLAEHAWEIWVRTSGLGPGQTVGGLICPDYGMISYIAGDGTVVYYLYNTDAGYPGTYIVSLNATSVNMFDGNWHHIICTRQQYGLAYIYIDGEVKATSGNTGDWSGSTIWSSMAMRAGHNPNDTPYHLYGDIALVRIYKKYFTASEVEQNYLAQKSRFGL